MDERDQIGFLILVTLVITLILLIRKYLQYKKKQFKQQVQERGRRATHHQDDIYNISGRVQGEEQQHSNQDAYLSIDHITITNQLNKPNYDDAPPSYEEAMRIAASHSSGSSEVPTVVVIPKTTD